MRRVLVLALALTLTVALGGLTAAPASAEGIRVNSEAANNRFPEGIRFSIFLAAEGNVTAARLRYRVLPDGALTSAVGECTAGANASCTVDVGNTPATYMVPGAEVRYFWEVDDAAGNHLQTEEQVAVYEDDRFIWEAMSDGQVTLYSYTGSDSFNQDLIDAANETIVNFSRIEGTTLEFPIKIWVYADPQDLAQAIASSGGQGITHGQVSVSDTALVSRSYEAVETVRHEVAHLVTRRATRSEEPVGDNYTRYEIPIWINEGISVFAQGALSPDQAQALDLAVRADRVLPITSLSPSTRSTGDTVGLFYGESGSLVAFLVNSYGEEKFAEFIRALKSQRTDGALQQVYGFGQIDWENQWRVSFGLPEVEDSGGNQPSNDAIPTLAPLGGLPQTAPTATPPAGETPQAGDATPTATSSDADDGDGGGSSTALIVGGVVVVLALLGGAGFALTRRRGSSGA